MKKLVLTSLFAMFAVSGVQAANVINNNPLYRPTQGHFYSITDATAWSGEDYDFRYLVFKTKFGYGITDRLSLSISGAVDAYIPEGQPDYAAWQGLGGELNFRGINEANWKLDIYGSIYVDGSIGAHWYQNDYNQYNWAIGMRGGYVSDNWTLAGLVEYNYYNSEIFNWGDPYWLSNFWKFGLNGQYIINNNWNITAGLRYDIYKEEIYIGGEKEHEDRLHGIFGINYNFDSTKFIGLYTEKQLDSDYDIYIWGVKFGIDF